MFDAHQEQGQNASSEKTPRSAERPGFPIDPRRILIALKRRGVVLLAVAIVGSVMGALIGKFLVPKNYRAASTVLWEPPVEARADAMRELNTLAQSVKLPDNLRAVREKLSLEATLEGLAGNIDVKVGENSMLITVVATDEDRDRCAAIANVIVEVFLSAQKEVAAGRLREIAQALRSSLALAEADLRGAKKAYADFRTEFAITDASVETQAAIEELARLRVAANDARVELETLRARENSLRASRDGSPKEVVASRNELAPSVARLAEAQTELAEARAKFTPDHPKTKALEAEVEALRAAVDVGKPAVTSRVVTRSPMRDNLAAQVEELTALRKSIEQRGASLSEVLATAEQRAATLTTAQTQAARLLADVQVSENHVKSLLEQIASSEDDVRKASSDFQVVSKATPPPWPEKGKGRMVAVAIPLVMVLLVGAWVIVRALFPLRAWGACEVAYFASAPVLWATSWPGGSLEEARNASRELADVFEAMPGVFGVTAGSAQDDFTPQLAELIAERLRRRGSSCEVLDLRDRRPSSDDITVADALEGANVGAEIEDLRRQANTVFVLIPSLSQMDAVRAARRWLDGIVAVVPSGGMSPLALLVLRKSLGMERGSLAFVLARTPPPLLSPNTRTFGEFEINASWKSAVPPPVATVDAPR